MDYDIVIVGGGIAGLNLCYQIIKKTDKLKILLIEKNNYLIFKWISIWFVWCSYFLTQYFHNINV